MALPTISTWHWLSLISCAFNMHIALCDFSLTILLCSTHSIQFFFFNLKDVFHFHLIRISFGVIQSIYNWVNFHLMWTQWPYGQLAKGVLLVTVGDLSHNRHKYRKRESVGLEFWNYTLYYLGDILIGDICLTWSLYYQKILMHSTDILIKILLQSKS